MPIVVRATVFPDIPGGFRVSTFVDMLQQQITLPGLDPTYEHTLVDALVAEDGTSAELVVHCEPPASISLDRAMRVVTRTPDARIRAFDSAGVELATGSLSAPLHVSDQVQIGDDFYKVTDVQWPNRDDNGVCLGDIDWEHVTLTPVPQVAQVPSVVPPEPAN